MANTYAVFQASWRSVKAPMNDARRQRTSDERTTHSALWLYRRTPDVSTRQLQVDPRRLHLHLIHLLRANGSDVTAAAAAGVETSAAGRRLASAEHGPGTALFCSTVAVAAIQSAISRPLANGLVPGNDYERTGELFCPTWLRSNTT